MRTIETIETTWLGDRCYVVHDGDRALVVDPPRDIDRVLEVIREHDLRVDLVVETHLHNDYVSGGLVLSRVLGSAYGHAADEDLTFDHEPLHDGDERKVGTLRVEVLHTPGHTHHHLSYAVHQDGSPVALFTGGSLLHGSVGRTDLLGDSETEELTRAQYRTARQLADRFGPDALVYPTHGFGSFCTSASTDEESDGTLGRECEINIALTADDEDSFVDELLSGLTDHPRYYAHMGALNRAGGQPVDLSPPAPVDAGELRDRLARGEWVVDLRDRVAYAHDHVEGTVGIQLADGFTNYLGWILPWGTPVTLLADDADDVAASQRQLVNIGIDRPAGAAVGSLDEVAGDLDRASYRVADFADLASEMQSSDPAVVDVRRADEYDDGHVRGAINVPIHELLPRLDELPHGPMWVHCASGYRASIAASLLARAGHEVVLIDDAWDAAADADVPVQ